MSLDVKGVPELIKKCDPATIRGPLRNAMETIGAAAASSVRSTAPRGETGNLASHIEHKVGGAPIPFATIRATATAQSDGADYPNILEHSRKHGHSGWFRKGIERVQGRLAGILRQTAAEIERKWRT